MNVTENAVITYQLGATIKKAVAKAINGDHCIVLLENGKAEIINRSSITHLSTGPDYSKFKEWLQKNYTYSRLSDEWIRDGKRQTECSLYHKYLLLTT